jgi:prepilin-type N-terminal cleavage/methylation domain-containing protein
MRRRGFTFIEMSVVIVVLTIIAAMIVPNVVKMKESSDRQTFFSSLWRLAGRGRELAISEKKTFVMALDSSGRSFTLSEQDQGQTGQLTNDPDQSERGTLDIPEGIETGNLSADGDSSTNSTWEIYFYPDGTSNGGGLEVTDSGRTRSLRIRRDGRVQISNESLDNDDSEQSWPAGDFERRA